MKIKLFNTLSREKEEFKPLKNDYISIYACGPTVYNYAHIGNLLSYIRWDVLRRIFKYDNYQVKEVMNITDVDDKTIRDSQKEGKTLKEFTEFYTEKFFEDLEKLNIEKVEVNPKATDYIKEMLEIVEILIKKNIAYVAEDGVYFDISKFAGYGELAGLDQKGLRVGASGRVNKDEYDKDQAQDFVLWKFWDEKDGKVYWEPREILEHETQIKKGRPGWHIECSAMSKKLLGQSPSGERSRTIDIHTGGIDLVFPHHTNEIAQSEGAFGKKFVNYWIHNEHLLVDNKKMAKSAGNFYTLRDIEAQGFSPLAFRYLVLTTHYRKKLNFSWGSLKAADNALKKLYDVVKQLDTQSGKILKQYQEKFFSAINDDMNTPEALAVVWEMVKSDNKSADKYMTLLDFDRVLGLQLNKIRKEEIPTEILESAKKMDQARNNKDYETADKLRAEIEECGYIVKNTIDGSQVVKK